MKFKYDIKSNYYKMYGEANFLVLNKKKYLNDKNLIIKNFYYDYIFRTILSFLLLFLFILLNKIYLTIVLAGLAIINLFQLIILLNGYKIYKNQNHKGTIIINKVGITDDSDIKTTFFWDKVELVGITKDTLAIVLDSPFVLILEPNEKIIDEIKKYKDIKVVRN